MARPNLASHESCYRSLFYHRPKKARESGSSKPEKGPAGSTATLKKVQLNPVASATPPAKAPAQSRSATRDNAASVPSEDTSQSRPAAKYAPSTRRAAEKLKRAEQKPEVGEPDPAGPQIAQKSLDPDPRHMPTSPLASDSGHAPHPSVGPGPNPSAGPVPSPPDGPASGLSADHVLNPSASGASTNPATNPCLTAHTDPSPAFPSASAATQQEAQPLQPTQPAEGHQPASEREGDPNAGCGIMPRVESTGTGPSGEGETREEAVLYDSITPGENR